MPSNVSLFQTNPDKEMMKYGLIYILATLPQFPMFFIVIKALLLKNPTGSNLAYMLMTIINFFQFGQLLCHVLSGPMLVFPYFYARIKPFITVMGCWFNALWIGDFLMMTLLAICRILIFSKALSIEKIRKFTKFMLFLIIFWTSFLIIFGAVTQNFYLSQPGWDYDYDVFGIEFFEMQEIIISFSCLTLSYIAYIFMAYLIYTIKNLSSCVQSRRDEVMILFQSTFVTTYITWMILIWHQALFSDISVVDMNLRRNQALMNLALICHCYVNPTLTIILNKSIRKECRNIIWYPKPDKIYSMTITSSVHPIKNT